MHEKKMLTGLLGWDIVVGWFSAGPLFLLLWVVSSLMFGRLRPALDAAGAKLGVSAPLCFDLGIFLLDMPALLAAYALVSVVRRRCPYLAWSFGAGVLPACIYLSLLADCSNTGADDAS